MIVDQWCKGSLIVGMKANILSLAVLYHPLSVTLCLDVSYTKILCVNSTGRLSQPYQYLAVRAVVWMKY